MSTTTHTVTYKTCGHTARVRVTHNGASERDNKLAWMADNQVCPDCYAAQQAQAKAEKIAADHEANKADAMAEQMTGSDKQVAWALSIRRELLAAASARMDQLLTSTIERRPDLADQARANAGIIAEQLLAIGANTSAKWWIDNRSSDLLDMARDAAAAQARKDA